MRPALIVTDEEVVENGLHLVDCLERSAPAFGGGLLQPQQALVLGQKCVTLPNSPDAASGDLDTLETKLLLDAHRAATGIDQRMVEHGMLDLADTRLGCGPRVPGSRSISPLGAVGLEVAAESRRTAGANIPSICRRD